VQWVKIDEEAQTGEFT